ncbi:hypothetical protein V8D89_006694 [Ganoderma adspersum]
MLGTTAASAFSALRAYALSNRNKWLASLIILLALPPPVIAIVEFLYEVPENMPSPFNCGSTSTSSSPALDMNSHSAHPERLYSQPNYSLSVSLGGTHINRIVFGREFILEKQSSPAYYNPILLLTDSDHGRRSITSILVCHFMLYLREFDSNASATQGSQIREHAGSTFLEFSAKPSYSLPAFIASFANPVHVHPDNWSETASDSDVIGGGDSEAATAPSSELDTVSRQS